MIIQGRRKSGAQRNQQAAVNSLTREIINRRFAAVISHTRHLPVIREDVLGEGEGAWDPDPRYPTGIVNCLIWLQLVISEIYGWGEDLETKIRIMDRIRYYGGHVAYGLRKSHYIDHWLALEPEPLVRIRLNRFAGYMSGLIKVRKEQFKSFHSYPCQLYREEFDTFHIDYITGEGLLACVKDLAPGYYISFGVAGPYYLSLYGRGCGPMGLVHSLIIKVNEPDDVQQDDDYRARQALVYHASIVSGSVNEMPLPEYVEKMSPLFSGYALFELDPHWDFLSRQVADEEVLRILRCEAALPPNQDYRKL